MLEPKAAFPLFFAVWVLLALGGFWFFQSSQEVAKKRRYFPRFTVGAGALFVLVIALMAPRPAVLLFFPFIALVTWLNIRLTRFCDCGHMLINQMWWKKMSYCPYCGKKLVE